MYTKIAQIKILYDNECTKNVHQIPTYIQKIYKLYKTWTKLRPKTAWNLKFMFFVHTNNVQTIQNLYNYLTETAFVCFLCIQIMCKLYKIYTTETAFVCLLYIQTMYKLYKMYTNVNRVIYAPADVLHV